MPQSRPSNLSAAFLRRHPLPVPANSGKDERGAILVVAGAERVPGAAILSATAALRAGAGKLSIATASEAVTNVAVAMPEALVMPFEDLKDNLSGADAVVFGPGMIDEQQCLKLMQVVIEKLKSRVLLDAGAITMLARDPGLLKRHGIQATLTPHAGEMATLMQIERDCVESEPERHVAAAAREFGAIVVLKGADTYIATPAGEVLRHRGGTPGLATSGSGDVLAGIIGGFLARGLTPVAASAWGVVLHARAGASLMRKAGVGFLARELPAEIPLLMRRLSRKNTER